LGENLISEHVALDLVEAKEGQISFLVPRENLLKSIRNKHWKPVFYNPIMEFNRDLSVVAIECHRKNVSRDIRVLDAMTGCGVRGIRYAVEVQNVAHVLLNDVQRTASELAIENVKRNNVGDRVEISRMDANSVLALNSAPDSRFDVIDLDPFGSPAPFMDSAVRASANKALMTLTATDLPPLCGIRPGAALRKYGGRPLRTEYCQEVGARLLIASLAAIAARHDMGIDVKLAHSTDHYIRIYAMVRHGSKIASQALDRLGYIAHCFCCSNREWSSRLFNIGTDCKICGQRYAFAGPVWLGNLYDKKFCDNMLQIVATKKLGKKSRVIRLLKMVLNDVDYIPTYHRIDRLCDRYQIPTPKPECVVEELRTLGYVASLTHFHGYGIRTEAGPKILMQILRELSQKTHSQQIDL